MTWGNQNTKKEAHEQLSYAFDNGINILDTTEVYPVPIKNETQGNTDRIINPWLKTRVRDKVIIATKVVEFSDRETSLRDKGKGTRVDASNIKESVEKLLKRLGTDYIDLLQIHWPDRYVPLFGEYMYNPAKWRDSIPFAEQLQALSDVIKEGKVRYLGVSNETSFGVMKFVHIAKTFGLPKIVSIQNSYSLLVRCPFEVNLVEICDPQNCNIGLLAYSPLAGGVLSGKYLNMDSQEAKRGLLGLFPGYMDRYLKSLASEAVSKYVDLAHRHGLTPSQHKALSRLFFWLEAIGGRNVGLTLNEEEDSYARESEVGINFFGVANRKKMEMLLTITIMIYSPMSCIQHP
ncbi:hypothetical protein KP509_20G076400 [Ceratopteris richardii]|uniref:NADP-dependent oxidoreductase domain-containing protein n=1 Tax=Ceratopteris richardii TaxID=49495 RepID=A0A8T2SI94_CERRI|nr:hypothetical protein KP509_20G076400 [Ceratopteris richardii]